MVLPLFIAGDAYGEGPKPSQLPECPEELSAEAPNDATPPPTAPAAPCGQIGRSHYVYRRSPDGEILPIRVEGPRGPQVRAALSYDQLAMLLASGDLVPPELQMSREQLAQLVDQLSLVRTNAEKYQDVNVALADGYVPQQQAGKFVQFVHAGYVDDGLFNLFKPEFLVYEAVGGKAGELVAVVFALRRQDVGDDHPAGFAGPLDNWHIRYNECTRRAAADAPSRLSYREPDECLRLGGSPPKSNSWKLYVWLWNDQGLGVFGKMR